MGAYNTLTWNGNGAAAPGAPPLGTVSAGGLIYGALRLLTALGAPGRGANPETMADCLSALNDLIDSWNADRLKIDSITRDVYPLNAGQASYEFGPGGLDIDAPRPIRIDRAGILIPNQGNEIEQPLKIFTLGEWEATGLKAIQTPIPAALYCDYAAPIAHFSLWPVLSAPTSIVFYDWTQFLAFADYDTAYLFPPGYALALRFNLAVQIAPLFVLQMKGGRTAIQAGRVLMASIEAQAMSSLGTIKNNNLPRPVMRSDPAFTHSRGRGLRFDSRSNDWL